MQVHSIYCGLQSSDLTEDQARQLVLDLAAEHFPNGHTIHEATGRWRGVMVQCDEPTLIIEVWQVDGFGIPPIGDCAADYKELARQESVVILSHQSDAVVI